MNREKSEPVITTTSVTATVIVLLVIKTVLSFIVWKWAEWLWKLVFGEKKVKDGANQGVPAESPGKETDH